jgi:exosome complex component RRP4
MGTIVVPGEVLERFNGRSDNVFFDGNKAYSKVLGTYDSERGVLTPLEGLWYPRMGDTVIGIVEEDKFNIYIVYLNAPYKGIVMSKFIEEPLAAGDIIEAVIKDIDRTKTAVLTRVRKLNGGKIISVKPSKIPRIMGHGDTMIKQLVQGTKCTLVVGLNGVIWISGGNYDLAAEAIFKIVEEAHTPGLTERVRELLEGKK